MGAIILTDPALRALPRAKGKTIVAPFGWVSLAFFLLMPAHLFGQMMKPPNTIEKARISASASSSYQFKTNMDGGGDVSIARYGISAGGAAGRSSSMPEKTGQISATR